MRVNVESAKKSFEPMPSGKYHLAMTKHETKKTKAGDDMEVLIFTVQEGEFAGRKLYVNAVDREDCHWATIIMFETILGKEFPKEEIDIDFDDLLGVDTYGNVVIGEHEGKPNNQIESFETFSARSSRRG